jgi:plastocyanin
VIPPARRPLLRAAAALLLGVAWGSTWGAEAAASGPAASAVAPPTPDAGAVVEIRDYRFLPASVTVKVGAPVRWLNAEKRSSHTVRFEATADAAAIESDRLFPGEAWERRFTRPGRYPYRCGPHPEMLGEVVVLD